MIADPKMARTLDNPKLTAGDKEALLLSVLAPELQRGSSLDKEGRNFLRVLVEAERIALLPYVGRRIRHAEERGRRCREGADHERFSDRRAPSSPSITSALERRFGKKIEATVSVDRS